MQQMEVLGHDDVPQDDEAIAAAHLLQSVQEEIAALAGAEQGLAMITTGSEKVQMARSVIALKVSGHEEEPRSAPGCEVCDG